MSRGSRSSLERIDSRYLRVGIRPSSSKRLIVLTETPTSDARELRDIPRSHLAARTISGILTFDISQHCEIVLHMSILTLYHF